MKLRIVFMGTPEFSVPALKALCSCHEVVGVYTQPDRLVGRGLKLRFSAIKQTALTLSLPLFQPERLSQMGEFEKLKALSADVIVVVAYGQILKSNVLALPPLGCVNIHFSLLPRWRGAAPIQWALLAGDSETGVTAMQMSEKLDAGGIYAQEKTKISLNDTSQSLHERLSHMAGPLILETLERVSKRVLSATVQNEDAVTLAPKLDKQMQWLSGKDSCVYLERKIRALALWPGTSVRIHGMDDECLKIIQAKVRLDIKAEEGVIFEKAGMLLFGAKEGCLELLSFQWEGKKIINASQFLNGLRGKGISLPLRIHEVL